MRVIGLIGGMSWESTLPYYRLINEGIREQLGGLHSAKLVLYSVDFHEIERLEHADDWDAAAAILAEAGRAIEAAGAEFIVLCTNTMHKVAPAIEAAVSIPLIHIVDATGDAVRKAGLRKVGLLATRFTMEQPFYSERLRERYGLDVIVPPQSDREIVHRVIYGELCLGRIVESSRNEYQRIIGDLVRSGAEAIILGCTEISLLVAQSDSPVPLFDTTAIHAEKAVALALT